WFHRYQIDSTVHATGDLGHVHIKTELLAKHVEHLVFVFIFQQVHSARGDVQCTAMSGQIGLVIHALISTVLRTGDLVRTGSWIPLVVVETILTLNIVKPSPFGIHHHFAVNVRAMTTLLASLPGQWRVNFGLTSASLLTDHH